MNKTRLAIGGAAALVIAGGLAFGVFGVHTAFVDRPVNETLDERGTVIASGSFHDVAHAVQGEARVVEAEGGRRLQLVDFEVDNGPDLEMWVVALDDATDDQSVTDAKRLVLGPLKGNVGDQEYVLPDDFDPKTHKAVVVWCERFGVNFATAPLEPAS